MFRTILPAILTTLTMCGLAAPATAAPAATPAAEGERCQGTMELGGKTYPLKFAVAYAVKVFDDDGYAVLFSDQAIPVEKLRATLASGKGSDDGFFFFKPHVRVTFDKAGKPMFCNAWADNNSLSVSGSKLGGELAVKDGRARGKASLKSDPDDKGKSSFDVPSFDLATLALPAAAAAKDAPAKPGVSKSDDTDSDKPEPAAGAGPKPAAVSYKDLPLPEGATGVEFKKLVGHIRCQAPGTVRAVADDLAKKLAAQGWQAQGKDVVSTAATLRRTRADATLTIVVKSVDAERASVMILSTGLGWEEKE